MSEVHLYPWFEQPGKMTQEHYLLNDKPTSEDDPRIYDHSSDKYGGRTETWYDSTWFNLHIGETHDPNHLAQIRVPDPDTRFETDFVALAPGEERIITHRGRRFFIRHLAIETQ